MGEIFVIVFKLNEGEIRLSGFGQEMRGYHSHHIYELVIFSILAFT